MKKTQVIANETKLADRRIHANVTFITITIQSYQLKTNLVINIYRFIILG